MAGIQEPGGFIHRGEHYQVGKESTNYVLFYNCNLCRRPFDGEEECVGETSAVPACEVVQEDSLAWCWVGKFAYSTEFSGQV